MNPQEAYLAGPAGDVTPSVLVGWRRQEQVTPPHAACYLPGKDQPQPRLLGLPATLIMTPQYYIQSSRGRRAGRGHQVTWLKVPEPGCPGRPDCKATVCPAVLPAP